MKTTLEVLLTPAEFALLPQRDLRQTVCVVFDVLRATTSMLTALANGAAAVIPVAEIGDALAVCDQRLGVLLAGERNGLRIRAEQAGGIDFDLGNSPREFLADKVRDQTIIMTTTNGTRALQACAGAQRVLVAAFLNLKAVANWIKRHHPPHLILVCSGTHEEAALEDTLAAGALCERIWPLYFSGTVNDSAEMARRLFPLYQHDLAAAMKHARNGRRLLEIPELRADVRFCVQRETLPFVAELRKDGSVVKLVD